jgi:hypothetical protein
MREMEKYKKTTDQAKGTFSIEREHNLQQLEFNILGRGLL